MMLLPVVLMVLLPKMMNNIDPEAQKVSLVVIFLHFVSTQW